MIMILICHRSFLYIFRIQFSIIRSISNLKVKHMKLIPGTIVQIDFGLYKHPGLVSDKTINSIPMIISNSFRKKGVYEESWEDFSNGKKVEILGYPGNLSSTEVLNRARSKIGTRWNLFFWNCEHFINWSHGRNPRSPQVRIYATFVVATAGLAFLLSKGKSSTV